MSSRDTVSGEIARLRRTMRDLVALSALPAAWTGYDSGRISGSLADAVLKTLSLELVYIRFPRHGGEEEAETVRSQHETTGADDVHTIREVLAPRLRDTFSPTSALPDPFGRGTLHIAITRFGYGGDAGVMVAGSLRSDFPTEQERLLLSVAANQAAIAIQRCRVEEERLDLLEREREALNEAQILNELARTLSAELDLQRLLQKVTDAGTELTAAKFGAFSHNTAPEHGEAYPLFTLSGATRETFGQPGLLCSNPLFAPTFRGEGVVRIDDVLNDARAGGGSSLPGVPPMGDLPVRSYLAVPVVSRGDVVLGALFFGHPEPRVFTERDERLATAIAAHAAIAIDNAQLYGQAQREIAERRRAEESERTARTQAERASRLRDEFLATVSHELRTPLSGVLGWTEVLRRATHDESMRARAIEAIERGARAQTRLIEDLLDMSRIISGKLRLEMHVVELLPLVESAIETVRLAAEAKSIRIERFMDPLIGSIKADPSRIQQILWNLLSNAVKFTPNDGTVQMRAERIASHIQISVRDTGRGIAPDFLPHVFDRFSQGESSTTRQRGGLGLGLAVVKHLVELHGGSVWAVSPGEGQGATFSLHLPVTASQGSPQHGHSHAFHPRGDGRHGEVKLTNVRVLVVDDDADACEVLRRLLHECEAQVVTVTSAREALARLSERSPDIVVSDIGMPEMDGYQLIHELRSRGHTVPAVAVTAFARSEDRVRVLQAGYNMHVAKPLEPRELIAVIAALVRPTSRE